jgi:phosphoenolpyruvate carboxykinase (GTP)
VAGTAAAVQSPIGLLPALGKGGLDLDGLEGVSAADLEQLFAVDTDGWRASLEQVHAHYETFGDRLPVELEHQLEALESRLG